MQSVRSTKSTDKPSPRGGKPPKGVKRVAARPMGASGDFVRAARLGGSVVQ